MILHKVLKCNVGVCLKFYRTLDDLELSIHMVDGSSINPKTEMIIFKDKECRADEALIEPYYPASTKAMLKIIELFINNNQMETIRQNLN
jgi:hypothetical protein